MTQLLEKVFERAAQLSDEDQDDLARLMLAELESDRRWSDLLADAESEELLDKLAGEALQAHRSGRTRPLRPDEL